MSTRRIDDLLDLNEVQRWNSRVRLLRRQTVAEHTFNVMAIAYEIVCLLDLAPTVSDKHRMMYRVLRWALVHDGPESETGDINYLFKRNIDRRQIDELELAACPWYKIECEECPSWARAIVKIADKIEEYKFIMKWTDPIEQGKWIPGILEQINKHVQGAMAVHGWRNLTSIIHTLTGGALFVNFVEHGANQQHGPTDQNPGGREHAVDTLPGSNAQHNPAHNPENKGKVHD